MDSDQFWPLEKPVMAAEGPKNILQAQAEKWIDGIERRREDYGTQIDFFIRGIHEGVHNLATTTPTTTRWLARGMNQASP